MKHLDKERLSELFQTVSLEFGAKPLIKEFALIMQCDCDSVTGYIPMEREAIEPFLSH